MQILTCDVCKTRIISLEAKTVGLCGICYLWRHYINIAYRNHTISKPPLLCVGRTLAIRGVTWESVVINL